jgi:hypothetical protein
MRIWSQCWICSRIYWDDQRQKCPRCGGLCLQRPEEDTRCLERRAAGGDRSAASAINVRS